MSGQDDLIISPAKITKYAGNRYHIEIPQSLLNVAERFHGKPISVTIRPMPLNQGWAEPALNFDKRVHVAKLSTGRAKKSEKGLVFETDKGLVYQKVPDNEYPRAADSKVTQTKEKTKEIKRTA